MTYQRIAPKDLNNLTSSASDVLKNIPGDGLKGIYSPVNILGTLLYGEKLLGDFLTYWVNSKNNMSLSVKEQELIILRMGFHYKCDYVWKHHIPVAIEFGITSEQQLELKIKDFNQHKFDQVEATLIRICDEMIETKNVADKSWREAMNILSANQVIDLIHLVGQYVIFALTNNVFKVEVESSLKDFSSVQ